MNSLSLGSMKYMVNEYEKQNTILTNRFLTSSKEKAFKLAESLNLDHNGKNWYVGMRIKDRVCIDIDASGRMSIDQIQKSYETLLGFEFLRIQTAHGFHLVAKKKSDLKILQWNRCRILCPFLSFDNQVLYERMVIAFFDVQKEQRTCRDYTKEELQKNAQTVPMIARDIGIAYPLGNIDILHALLGIRKRYYVLRISKKSKDEKMEILK